MQPAAARSEMVATIILFIKIQALQVCFKLEYVSAKTFTVRVTACLDTRNAFTFFQRLFRLSCSLHFVSAYNSCVGGKAQHPDFPSLASAQSWFFEFKQQRHFKNL